jgi:hypothetical protein
MGTPERRFPPTVLLWEFRKGGFHQLFFYGYYGKEVSTNCSSMGTPERRFPPILLLWVFRKGGFHQLFFYGYFRKGGFHQLYLYGYSGKEVSTNTQTDQNNII